MSDAMRNVFRAETRTAAIQDERLNLCQNVDPQIIFVATAVGSTDGAEFTRKLRHRTIACRNALVIIVTSVATAEVILAARDAGAHELLRKPFATRDLLRRLEAVTLRERAWVETVSYIGPDRRRFNSGDKPGLLKRPHDTPATSDTARLTQALKMLHPALAAFDTDPVRAQYLMKAQLKKLKLTTTAAIDLKLVTAVTDFQRHVGRVMDLGGTLTSADLMSRAATVLAYRPKLEQAAT